MSVLIEVLPEHKGTVLGPVPVDSGNSEMPEHSTVPSTQSPEPVDVTTAVDRTGLTEVSPVIHLRLRLGNRVQVNGVKDLARTVPSM